MASDAMSYPDPREDLADVVDDDADEHGVVYPVEDSVGETGLQQLVILGLMLPLRDYFAARRRDVLVSTDQFLYYRRGDPTAVVSPDLYLIDGVAIPVEDIDCWKTWEHDGLAPQLAIEVVSSRTYAKDYSEATLSRYEALGVRELVRYDPILRRNHGRRRHKLSHWVRDAHGTLRAREVADGRVHSEHFDFWLTIQPDRTLRMCPDGVTPWPSPTERVHAAEAEIQRLRAELARHTAR